MNRKSARLYMLEFFVVNKCKSISQVSQDLLILYFTQLKKNGFFVEIGAADGFYMSNTLLLEIFGWNGIIVEPLPTWHEKIKKSNSRVIFEDVLDYPELSGITEDLEQDNNASPG
jgi:hypothetical protein